MSCITNLNFLYNTYFTLRFYRGTDSFELLCQRANIPAVGTPTLAQPTTLGTTVPVPSLEFQYENLVTEFIVDSTMENWKSIYSWMRNLANIESDNTNNLAYQEWHHQAVLTVYSPTTHCPIQKLVFKNIVPIALGGINFVTTAANAEPITCTCTFKYSYYDLDPDAPSNLKNEG